YNTYKNFNDFQVKELWFNCLKNIEATLIGHMIKIIITIDSNLKFLQYSINYFNTLKEVIKIKNNNILITEIKEKSRYNAYSYEKYTKKIIIIVTQFKPIYDVLIDCKLYVDLEHYNPNYLCWRYEEQYKIGMITIKDILNLPDFIRYELD